MNKLFIVFILILISVFGSCEKEKEKESCDCGHIIRNTNDGELWIVVIQNDCSGELDTTVWHFDMSDCKVGDVVCELKEIELDTCKTKLDEKARIY